MKKVTAKGRGRGRGRGVQGDVSGRGQTKSGIRQPCVGEPSTSAASQRRAGLLPFLQGRKTATLIRPEEQEQVLRYIATTAASSISSSSTPSEAQNPPTLSSSGKRATFSQSTPKSVKQAEVPGESCELFSHTLAFGSMDLSGTPSAGVQEAECSDAQQLLGPQLEDVEEREIESCLPKRLILMPDDDETQVPVAGAYATVSQRPEGEALSVEEEEVDDEALDPSYRSPREAAVSSSEEEAEMALRRKAIRSSVQSRRRAAEESAPTGSGGTMLTQSCHSVRRNPAWEFFKTVPPDMTKVVCLLCRQPISRGKDVRHLSSSAMVRHLRLKHTAVWESQKKRLSMGKDTQQSSPALPSASPVLPSSAATTASPQDLARPLEQSPPPRPRSSQSNISVQSFESNTIQPSLPEVYARRQKYRPSHERARKLTGAISKLLSMEMLPFRLVETDAFRNLMACAVPQYVVPSRHLFSRNAVPALHRHVEQRIKHALHQCVSGQVHLTTDTWTSKHGQGRYISLTAHWVNVVAVGPEGCRSASVLPTPRRLLTSPGTLSSSSSSSFAGSSSSSFSATPETSFSSPVSQGAGSLTERHRSRRGLRQQAVLKLICLGEKSHTAAELRQALKMQTDAWLLPQNLEPGKVVCDNGRNLVAALRLAKLTHVPCLAHVFNLVVQCFLRNYPHLPRLLDKVRKVCSHVRRSSTAASHLAHLQRKHNLPAHRLICDLATRWNSTYYMLARILEQKAAIVDFQMMVDSRARDSEAEVQLTAVEWAKLQDLCLVLRCMEDCTKLVSADDAIISMTIPLLCLLSDTLTAMKDEVCTAEEEEEVGMARESHTATSQSVYSAQEQRLREGGLGAIWQPGSQNPMSTGGSQVQVTEEEEEEEDEEEEYEQQDNLLLTGTRGIERGWGDAEEVSTPPATQGELQPGTLQHMCAYMIHFLDNDSRVSGIQCNDEYWVATLLDPRYRDKLPSLLTSGQRDSRLQIYEQKILEDLMREFPQHISGSSTSIPASGHQQGSRGGHRHHRGSSAGSSDTRSRMAMVWKSFLATTTATSTSDTRITDHKQYLSSQVKQYLTIGIDVIQHGSFPFDFWVSKLDTWPELAQYAIKVLACPAASVISERVFSTAGGVITDRRTRLSTENVDILSFIKMNRSWIAPDYTHPVVENEPL